MTDLPSCMFPSIQLRVRSPDHDSQPRTSRLQRFAWLRMPTENCAISASIPRFCFLLTRVLPRHWHRVGEWGIVLGGAFSDSVYRVFSDSRLQVVEGLPPSMVKGGLTSAISRVPLMALTRMSLRELHPTEIWVVNDTSPPPGSPRASPTVSKPWMMVSSSC